MVLLLFCSLLYTYISMPAASCSLLVIIIAVRATVAIYPTITNLAGLPAQVSYKTPGQQVGQQCLRVCQQEQGAPVQFCKRFGQLLANNSMGRELRTYRHMRYWLFYIYAQFYGSNKIKLHHTRILENTPILRPYRILSTGGVE